MVRALSNKYIPVPLLEEVEINILQSLKDFRHRARKRAAAANEPLSRNQKANQDKEPPHQTRQQHPTMIYGKNLPKNLTTTKNNTA